MQLLLLEDANTAECWSDFLEWLYGVLNTTSQLGIILALPVHCTGWM